MHSNVVQRGAACGTRCQRGERLRRVSRGICQELTARAKVTQHDQGAALRPPAHGVIVLVGADEAVCDLDLHSTATARMKLILCQEQVTEGLAWHGR